MVLLTEDAGTVAKWIDKRQLKSLREYIYGLEMKVMSLRKQLRNLKNA